MLELFFSFFKIAKQSYCAGNDHHMLIECQWVLEEIKKAAGFLSETQKKSL